eukprot:CAMPEP_0118978532 /NCGR_PEP_ID=MMETSP1173-20130426/23933_1 /TAXON_ID=1034831 /ORGANISM="Rhizochromulina marina cf, Strain CCMP1243" /LENGTH=112 /DNA_ID=CAMNT_0006928731 /DNA_START=1 /DNA_END=339 /DNA_ORIENTATION=+
MGQPLNPSAPSGPQGLARKSIERFVESEGMGRGYLEQLARTYGEQLSQQYAAAYWNVLPRAETKAAEDEGGETQSSGNKREQVEKEEEQNGPVEEQRDEVPTASALRHDEKQ